MKIAYYALRPFDELKMVEKYCEEYGYEFVWTSEYPNENNLSLSEGCQAVSFTPAYTPESYVDVYAKNGVKAILTRSIGFDHVPVAYAASKGIKTSNVSYPPECVANYAIMLILMATRKMNETMLRSIVQDYSLKGKLGRDLSEMTVGVLGSGHIGKTVIRHLAAFGCRLLTTGRHPDEEIKKYAEYVDTDTLIEQSDVITLHLASNQETYHIINSESIAKMKDGVIIVNTARGTLIDTDALIAGLKSGKIGGAALDVLEDEKNLYYVNRSEDVIDNDALCILRSYPNVILTPHTAFYTETTVRNMIQKGLYALHCYEQGIENPYEVRV